MTAVDWAVLAAIAAPVVVALSGGLMSFVVTQRRSIEGWAREVFASRADVAGLIERVGAIESDVKEVKDMVREILRQVGGRQR